MRKHTVLLLTLLFCLNLSSQRQMSYNTKNKKVIKLETVDTLSYICFRKDVPIHQRKVKLSNKVVTIRQEQQSELIRIDSPSEITQLKNDGNIESVYKVLRFPTGKELVVLTNEILVKVNPGKQVSSVLDNLRIPYLMISEIEELSDVSIVQLPTSDNTLDVVNLLVSSPDLVYAEPNFIQFIDGPTSTNATTDLYSTNQWSIVNPYGFTMDVLAAWKLSKGKDIKVAVLDEGVELTHPDLKDNLLPGYDATLGDGPGVNGAAAPGDSHGTACAGIIAALENNIGMTGIAPQSKVIPIRIAIGYYENDEKKWRTSSATIARGFGEAYRRGADVVSCSFSSTNVAASVSDAINTLTTNGRNGRGSVVVFSTGNDGSSTVSPYCNLPNVISVGNLEITGNRRFSSNYGSNLKVMAPGAGTYTTYPSGSYGTFGGTSAACPHVASVAALILSLKPNLSQKDVASAIYSSCTKLPGYQYPSPNRWNNETGYGLVSAYEAILASKPFTMIVPDLLCECETHTFSISGPTDRCDSIVWNLYFDKEIISGNGTTSVEVRILEAPGYALPFVASIYYGNRVVKLEEQAHAGVPETYDIIGGDEATEMELTYAEVIMAGATSYTWELKQGRCGIWPNNNIADLLPYDTNKVIIVVTGYNRCGSYAEWLSFTPKRRVSGQNSRQIGTKSVAIYNLSYELIYSDKNLISLFDINAVNLPSGFYVIESQLENGIITREKVYIP